MAKVAKFVGKVAGIVATVAMFIPGGQPIALIASGVAAVSNIAAGALAKKPKPPPAQGSVSQIQIEVNPPQPYLMGEGYYAGVLRHDEGYGATLDEVPNPYRGMVVVYSGGGPIESIMPQVEFSSAFSWYNGFLYTDTQLGAVPETSALAANWSGFPGWTANHKLSGQAAILWSFKFDKEGKRFASALPPFGAYGKWVKCYDPRLDSTFPGGSGAHRLGDETTYEWTENPALHAGTYAFGRYQNGKRTFGIGMPADGIDWSVLAAWANVCDANGWRMFGPIAEPGDRWANLKEICFAGGAEPIAGGVLSFKYHAPSIPLATITADDLTDDTRSVLAMQSDRDRVNTIVPKYRSPDHNWEIVDGDAVSISTFVTEDGEEKRETFPFNLVKDVDQASQLASYRIWNGRELATTIVCKPHARHYRPGECLELDLPELGLAGNFIILRRSIDPAWMKITFELLSETDGKHAFCLGQTGTPPPTPSLKQTPQQRDEIAASTLLATAIPGADAKVHIAYADSADGTLNFTTGVPNGRTYWGQYSDNLEADSTDPADYTWDKYAGPALFGLVPKQNVALGPDWVEKVSGGATYDAIAYSSETYQGGCVASFTYRGGRIVVGIDLLPSSIGGLFDVDYCFSIGNGSTIIYKNGAAYNQNIAPQVGDTFQVHYDGSKVRFYRKGVKLATEFATAAEQRFYLCALAYNLKDRVHSLKWAAAGPRGDPGPSFQIEADKGGFTFTDGALNPATQTVTFNSLLDGNPAQADWQTVPNVKSANDADTFTLSTAEMGTNHQVLVKAFLGGLVAQFTVSKVDQGKIEAIENEADVTRSVAGPPVIEIAYNANGSLKASQIPKYATFKLQSKGNTVGADVVWSWLTDAGTFTGAVPTMTGNGAGQLSISSDPAADEVLGRVRAVYSGRTYEAGVKIARKQDVAGDTGTSAGGDNNYASDSSLSSFSTTSFIAISDELYVTPTGTSLDLTTGNLSLRPAATGSGDTQCQVKWQRWNGSGWTDVGAAATSNPHPTVTSFEGFRDPWSGSITCNRQATGLSPGVEQRVRLVARISGGATRSITPTGQVSVQG